MEKMTLEEYINEQIVKCEKYHDDSSAGSLDALLRIKIFIKSDKYLEKEK